MRSGLVGRSGGGGDGGGAEWRASWAVGDGRKQAWKGEDICRFSQAKLETLLIWECMREEKGFADVMSRVFENGREKRGGAFILRNKKMTLTIAWY